MSSAQLTLLLQACGYLAFLLMAGTYLRAKVPVFGRLMLPASVIGGFIGLIFGPNVMGELVGISLPGITPEFLATWAALPGVLIVPIFAAAPLGNGMEPGYVKTDWKKSAPRIMMACGGFAAIATLQGVAGYGTNLLFKNVFGMDNIYRIFGYELGQGFAGGHGTAAGLGGILEGLGIANASEAVGVATTCATVGLIGGMLIGIFVINRAAEKGQLEKLGTSGKVGEIPKEMQVGLNLDIAKQPSMGREIGQASCIDTITIHMALILIGVALAYYFRTFMINCPIEFLSKSFKSIPVWFVALLMMYIVNFVLKALKLVWMVDKKAKARCVGLMSDFAICAAVASCNVKAVLTFIVPILVMCVLGFIVTYIGVFTFNKWLFKGDYPIERSVICWGTNTGVMITGMMLLKIADPNYETPALNEFAGGFALMSIISIFTSPITYGFLQTGSTFTLLLVQLVMSAMYFAIAIVGKLLYEARKKAEA
jgi:ESS family glutamate:Na+ symporter